MTTKDRGQLIQELASELEPVVTRSNILIPAISWFVCSWVYVIVLSIYLGPLREGALEAMIRSPQFAFESYTGLISSALFCAIAFQESIPGIQKRWLVGLSFVTLLLWIACYIAGLSFPAIEPSMTGKRAHCVLEAYIYSGPPLIVGYLLIYQRFPLNSIRAGIFLGICSGILPALFMQIACMYEPEHILTHHIAPMSVIILTGAILGLLFDRQRKSRTI